MLFELFQLTVCKVCVFLSFKWKTNSWLASGIEYNLCSRGFVQIDSKRSPVQTIVLIVFIITTHRGSILEHLDQLWIKSIRSISNGISIVTSQLQHFTLTFVTSSQAPSWIKMFNFQDFKNRIDPAF